jgi:WD40 repeat protein
MYLRARDVVCALLTAIAIQAQCCAQESGSGQWTLSTVSSAGDTDQAAPSKLNNVLLRREGREAITCSDTGEACVWDTVAGKVLRRIVSGEIETAWCIALSPDERQLVIGGKGKALHVRDVESGELTGRLDWATTIYSAGFLPDGKTVLFADSDGVVVRWEPGSETVQGKWDLAEDSITAMHISADGTAFVTGDRDGNVALWQFSELESSTPDEKPVAEVEFEGLNNTTCCLRFSPDQTRLAGVDYSGGIALWDIQTGKLLWLESDAVDEACWVEFFDNTRMAVVNGDNRLLLLVCETGEFEDQKIPMPDLAGFTLSRDGSQLWFGGNTMPFAWDHASASTVFPPEEIMPFGRVLEDMDFAPDNQALILTCREHPACRMNLSTGTIDWVLESEASHELEPSAKTIVTREGLVRVDTTRACLFDWSGEFRETANSESAIVLAAANRDTAKVLHADEKRQYHLDPFGSDEPRSESSDAFYLHGGKAGWLSNNHIAVFRNTRTLSIIDVAQGKETASREFRDGREMLDLVQGGMAIKRDAGLPLILCTDLTGSVSAREEDIEKWYRELDHDDFEIRETALRSLAGQGKDVIDRLQALGGETAEQRVRLRRLGQLALNRWVPDLSRETRWAETDLETVDCLCFDSSLRFLLVAVHADGQPELRIYTIQGDEVRFAESFPLRLRARFLRRAWDDPDLFAVAYSSGVVDVIRIGVPNASGASGGR